MIALQLIEGCIKHFSSICHLVPPQALLNTWQLVYAFGGITVYRERSQAHHQSGIRFGSKVRLAC